MHLAICESYRLKPAIAGDGYDWDNAGSADRRSAVLALLEEIRTHEPSRRDVLRAVEAASGGALGDAACARVADAVLALWGR